MSKKIFRSIWLAALIVLVLSLVLIMGVLYSYFTGVQQKQLRMGAEVVAQGVTLDGKEFFDGLTAEDYRITWIDADGTVLYDNQSDASSMENHLMRAEVQQALQNGTGESSRYSDTLASRNLYCARLLPDGTIIRLSAAQHSVWVLLVGFAQPICVILLLALVLSFLLASRLSRTIVEPINSLNLDEPSQYVGREEYAEIEPLLRRMALQQAQIRQDQDKLEKSSQIRQEFTANVSHELKTPLTSISGYAELIETGIAKPEDVPGFAQKIHGEASRMIQLVNDILQLSSLDNASETSSMPEMEVVDLLDVVKECVERQKLNARHAYITLTYLGESAPVRGNRNLLDELCQNLCDNAIRYNRPGGKVQIVTACTRDGHCSLTVTDNGIGIPRESQSSVFERFYRVDKSRSKATGGTGLGLAIVKHIALIHEARIKLESQVDVGTTITVTFPTAS